MLLDSRSPDILSLASDAAGSLLGLRRKNAWLSAESGTEALKARGAREFMIHLSMSLELLSWRTPLVSRKAYTEDRSCPELR
jgi:hypothetical protein